MAKDLDFTIKAAPAFRKSSREEEALQHLIDAWNSKNAKAAKRVGTFGFMAAALTACGGSGSITSDTSQEELSTFRLLSGDPSNLVTQGLNVTLGSAKDDLLSITDLIGSADAAINATAGLVVPSGQTYIGDISLFDTGSGGISASGDGSLWLLAPASGFDANTDEQIVKLDVDLNGGTLTFDLESDDLTVRIDDQSSVDLNGGTLRISDGDVAVSAATYASWNVGNLIVNSRLVIDLRKTKLSDEEIGKVLTELDAATDAGNTESSLRLLIDDVEQTELVFNALQANTGLNSDTAPKVEVENTAGDISIVDLEALIDSKIAFMAKSLERKIDALEVSLSGFTRDSEGDLVIGADDYATLKALSDAINDLQALAGLDELGASGQNAQTLVARLNALETTTSTAIQTYVSEQLDLLEVSLSGFTRDSEGDLVIGADDYATLKALSDAINDLQALAGLDELAANGQDAQTLVARLSDAETKLSGIASTVTAEISSAVNGLQQQIEGEGFDTATLKTLADLSAAIETLRGDDLTEGSIEFIISEVLGDAPTFDSTTGRFVPKNLGGGDQTVGDGLALLMNEALNYTDTAIDDLELQVAGDILELDTGVTLQTLVDLSNALAALETTASGAGGDLSALQAVVGAPASTDGEGNTIEASGLYGRIDTAVSTAVTGLEGQITDLESKITGGTITQTDYDTLFEISNALATLTGAADGSVSKSISDAIGAPSTETSAAKGLFIQVESLIATAVTDLQGKIDAINGEGDLVANLSTLVELGKAVKGLQDVTSGEGGVTDTLAGLQSQITSIIDTNIAGLQAQIDAIEDNTNGENAATLDSIAGLKAAVEALQSASLGEGGINDALANLQQSLAGLDITPPTVVDITLTASGGDSQGVLNAGDIVTATVAFTEAVLVTGSPTLQLDVGGQIVEAAYAGGAGTEKLSFTYTITASDSDVDGISVPENALQVSGDTTILDSAGNAANLMSGAAADTSMTVDNSPLALSMSAGTLFGASSVSYANTAFGVSESLGGGFDLVYLSELDGNGSYTVAAGLHFSLLDNYFSEDAFFDNLVTGPATILFDLSGKLVVTGLDEGISAVYSEDALRSYLAEAPWALEGLSVDEYIAQNTVPAETISQYDGFSAGETIADGVLAQISGHDPADVSLTVTSPLTVAQANALLEYGFAVENMTYSIRDYDTTVQGALVNPATADILRGAEQVTAIGDELDNEAMRFTSFDQRVNLRIEGLEGDDQIDAGRGDDEIVGGLGTDVIELTYRDNSDDAVVYQTIYDGETLPITALTFSDNADDYREGSVLTVQVNGTAYQYTTVDGDTIATALQGFATAIEAAADVGGVVVKENVLEIFGATSSTKLTVVTDSGSEDTIFDIFNEGLATKWTVSFSSDAADWPTQTNSGNTTIFERELSVTIDGDTIRADVAYDENGDVDTAQSVQNLVDAINEGGTAAEVRLAVSNGDLSYTSVTATGTVTVNGITYDLPETASSLADLAAAINDEFGQRTFARTSEIVVNTFTKGNQDEPDITALSDGGFLVTYYGASQDPLADFTEEDNDDSFFEREVWAQRFDADGNKVGGEFQINARVEDDQDTPSVTQLANGNLVFVWESDDGDSTTPPEGAASDSPGDGDGEATVARIFDMSTDTPTPLGDEFVVNQTTASNQDDPHVAALSNGGFVVVWEDSVADGDGNGVFARVFDASGNETVAEYQVNTTTTDNQSNPKVVGYNGGFIVAWEASDAANGDHVAIQNYDNNGAKIGSETNIVTGGSPFGIEMATLPNGKVAISWTAESEVVSRGGAWDAFFTIFDPDAPDAALVVTNVMEDQAEIFDTVSSGEPSVSALSDGGFVVVFEDQSDNVGGTGYDVWARQFNADGTPRADAFQLNTTTGDDQDSPVSAGLLDGGFVVSWEGENFERGPNEVFARVYNGPVTRAADLVASASIDPETGELVIKTSARGPDQSITFDGEITLLDGESGIGGVAQTTETAAGTETDNYTAVVSSSGQTVIEITGAAVPATDTDAPTFTVDSAAVDQNGTQQQTTIEFSSNDADYYEGGTLSVEISGVSVTANMVAGDAAASVQALVSAVENALTGAEPAVVRADAGGLTLASVHTGDTNNGWGGLGIDGQGWTPYQDVNGATAVDGVTYAGVNTNFMFSAGTALADLIDHFNAQFAGVATMALSDGSIVISTVATGPDASIGDFNKVSFNFYESAANKFEIVFQDPVSGGYNTWAINPELSGLESVEQTRDGAIFESADVARLSQGGTLYYALNQDGSFYVLDTSILWRSTAADAPTYRIDATLERVNGFYDQGGSLIDTSQYQDLGYVYFEDVDAFIASLKANGAVDGAPITSEFDVAYNSDTGYLAVARKSGGADFSLSTPDLTIGQAELGTGLTLTAATEATDPLSATGTLSYEGEYQQATISLEDAATYGVSSDGTDIPTDREPDVYYEGGKVYATITGSGDDVIFDTPDDTVVTVSADMQDAATSQALVDAINDRITGVEGQDTPATPAVVTIEGDFEPYTGVAPFVGSGVSEVRFTYNDTEYAFTFSVSVQSLPIGYVPGIGPILGPVSTMYISNSQASSTSLPGYSITTLLQYISGLDFIASAEIDENKDIVITSAGTGSATSLSVTIDGNNSAFVTALTDAAEDQSDPGKVTKSATGADAVSVPGIPAELADVLESAVLGENGEITLTAKNPGKQTFEVSDVRLDYQGVKQIATISLEDADSYDNLSDGTDVSATGRGADVYYEGGKVYATITGYGDDGALGGGDDVVTTVTADMGEGQPATVRLQDFNSIQGAESYSILYNGSGGTIPVSGYSGPYSPQDIIDDLTTNLSGKATVTVDGNDVVIATLEVGSNAGLNISGIVSGPILPPDPITNVPPNNTIYSAFGMATGVSGATVTTQNLVDAINEQINGVEGTPAVVTLDANLASGATLDEFASGSIAFGFKTSADESGFNWYQFNVGNPSSGVYYVVNTNGGEFVGGGSYSDKVTYDGFINYLNTIDGTGVDDRFSATINAEGDIVFTSTATGSEAYLEVALRYAYHAGGINGDSTVLDFGTFVDTVDGGGYLVVDLVGSTQSADRMLSGLSDTGDGSATTVADPVLSALLESAVLGENGDITLTAKNPGKQFFEVSDVRLDYQGLKQIATFDATKFTDGSAVTYFDGGTLDLSIQETDSAGSETGSPVPISVDMVEGDTTASVDALVAAIQEKIDGSETPGDVAKVHVDFYPGVNLAGKEFSFRLALLDETTELKYITLNASVASSYQYFWVSSTSGSTVTTVLYESMISPASVTVQNFVDFFKDDPYWDTLGIDIAYGGGVTDGIFFESTNSGSGVGLKLTRISSDVELHVSNGRQRFSVDGGFVSDYGTDSATTPGALAGIISSVTESNGIITLTSADNVSQQFHISSATADFGGAKQTAELGFATNAGLYFDGGKIYATVEGQEFSAPMTKGKPASTVEALATAIRNASLPDVGAVTRDGTKITIEASSASDSKLIEVADIKADIEAKTQVTEVRFTGLVDKVGYDDRTDDSVEPHVYAIDDNGDTGTISITIAGVEIVADMADTVDGTAQNLVDRIIALRDGVDVTQDAMLASTVGSVELRPYDVSFDQPNGSGGFENGNAVWTADAGEIAAGFALGKEGVRISGSILTTDGQIFFPMDVYATIEEAASALEGFLRTETGDSALTVVYDDAAGKVTIDGTESYSSGGIGLVFADSSPAILVTAKNGGADPLQISGYSITTPYIDPVKHEITLQFSNSYLDGQAIAGETISVTLAGVTSSLEVTQALLDQRVSATDPDQSEYILGQLVEQIIADHQALETPSGLDLTAAASALEAGNLVRFMSDDGGVGALGDVTASVTQDDGTATNPAAVLLETVVPGYGEIAASTSTSGVTVYAVGARAVKGADQYTASSVDGDVTWLSLNDEVTTGIASGDRSVAITNPGTGEGDDSSFFGDASSIGAMQTIDGAFQTQSGNFTAVDGTYSSSNLSNPGGSNFGGFNITNDFQQVGVIKHSVDFSVFDGTIYEITDPTQIKVMGAYERSLSLQQISIEDQPGLLLAANGNFPLDTPGNFLLLLTDTSTNKSYLWEAPTRDGTTLFFGEDAQYVRMFDGVPTEEMISNVYSEFNGEGIRQDFTNVDSSYSKTEGSAQSNASGEGTGDATYAGDPASIGAIDGEGNFNGQGVKQTFTNPGDGYTGIDASPQADVSDPGTGNDALFGSDPGVYNDDGLLTTYMNGEDPTATDVDGEGTNRYTSDGVRDLDLTTIIDVDATVSTGAASTTSDLGEGDLANDRTGFAGFEWDEGSTSVLSLGNDAPDVIYNFQVGEDADVIETEGELAVYLLSGSADGSVATTTTFEATGPSRFTSAAAGTEARLTGFDVENAASFTVYDTTPNTRATAGPSSIYLMNSNWKDVGQEPLYIFLPETKEAGTFNSIEAFESYLNATVVDKNGTAVGGSTLSVTTEGGDLVIAAPSGYEYGGMSFNSTAFTTSSTNVVGSVFDLSSNEFGLVSSDDSGIAASDLGDSDSIASLVTAD